MGQIHVMLAKNYGAGKVIGIDKIPFRLDKALEIGADEVINFESTDAVEKLKEITNGIMAHIVIVCPNSLKAMEDGLKLLSPAGTVVFFSPANPQDVLTININELYFKDISIVNSYSCGPSDTKEALDLIYSGFARPQMLITHRFSIEETKRAYLLVAEARDSLKVMINF
ncbi:MAG: zinc-binding dehydrogenase [Thermodesulfovibrionales bacterium]|nr:zinc-binding dehydrogenase [Thermodesulfovibrionales bacterium]